MDHDQYRRFLEYQEFQRFQEFQRQSGAAPGPQLSGPRQLPAADPAPRRAGAKALGITWKVVRHRWFLRLLVIGLVLLGINYAYQQIFGSSDSSTGEIGKHPAAKTEKGYLPKAASDTVALVYKSIATNDAAGACYVFTDAAARSFGADLGGPGASCVDAARAIKVTNRTNYSRPAVPTNAITEEGTVTEISSCQMSVDGGPPLGAFTLTKETDGGWIISGHRNEPADCPTPTASAAPTS